MEAGTWSGAPEGVGVVRTTFEHRFPTRFCSSAGGFPLQLVNNHTMNPRD